MKQYIQDFNNFLIEAKEQIDFEKYGYDIRKSRGGISIDKKVYGHWTFMLQVSSRKAAVEWIKKDMEKNGIVMESFRIESGSSADVYIDKGVVVKFTKDESEFLAWCKLREAGIFQVLKKFPGTPRIYELFLDETRDKKFIIIMEEINEIPDDKATKIEKFLMNKWRTTYLEKVLSFKDELTRFKTLEEGLTWGLLDFCANWKQYCQSIGINMKEMEIQNIGLKNGEYGFFDMGESKVSTTLNAMKRYYINEQSYFSSKFRNFEENKLTDKEYAQNLINYYT